MIDKIHNLWLKASRSPSELLEQVGNAARGQSNSEYQNRIDLFNQKYSRGFDTFLKNHVPTTSREYNGAELRRNPPDADAYIVGSDNVWATVNRSSFLGFVPDGRLRIAYAVSAPWDDLSNYWKTKAKKAIMGLHEVSVRESAGVEVCRKLGRKDVIHVLDPTLLLEAEDYRTLTETIESEDASDTTAIFGYFLNITRSEEFPETLLRSFSNLIGAPLQVVPLQGAELIVPEDLISTPDPAGWLRSIDRSRCVITNSFHGMVFSIILRKPFVVIPHQADGRLSVSSRFSSLLSLLGISERFFSGESAEDLEKVMNRPIDWDSVHSRLSTERQASLKFLRNAISLPH